MKTSVVQWGAAATISLAAHALLFFVLWIAADPDPVDPQSVTQARLDVESYEVDRSDAKPQEAEAERADVSEATGTSVADEAVPVSRAERSPIPSDKALRPTAPKPDKIATKRATGVAGQALETKTAPLRPAETPGARASAAIASPDAIEDITFDAISSTLVSVSPGGDEMLSAAAPTPGVVLQAALDTGTVVDTVAPVASALDSRGPESLEIERRQIVGIPSALRRPEAEAGSNLTPDAEPAVQQAASGFAASPAVASPEGDRATAALAWSGSGSAPVDPVSMAAIQAFMRPGDIGASVSNAGEVRDDIEALLASVPCSRLQTTFVPETGQLELRGHVPEDGVKAPVLAALQAHVGTAIPVADNLLVLPRPQCGALQGIGAVGLPQSTDQLTNPRVVGSDAHARVYDFAEGDRLEFDLVGADYDAVLYIDYYDADGNVLHLQPNEYLPLEMVEAQSQLMIGADKDGKPSLEIIVAPPFGQEIMVAMATSQPLYEGLRPIIEPAEPYLAFMRERVAEARVRHDDFKGEWVYFFVRTAAR